MVQGRIFIYSASKLYAPVVMGGSILPHKCVSGLVFCEAVEELLECLRAVYAKTRLVT